VLTKSKPLAEAHSSRGMVFGDFDNDGDVDILIINLNEPPSLLHKDVTGNNDSLKVQLIGTTSNRCAIGATVIACYGGREQAQTVLAQSSYPSVNNRRLHYGLGSATNADLGVRWPYGRQENIAKVAAGQLAVVNEGSRRDSNRTVPSALIKWQAGGLPHRVIEGDC
jgi:hypothetical protein